MQGAKLLWDQLLITLASESNIFLAIFLESIVVELANISSDALSERLTVGLHYWLTRILASSSWRNTLALQSFSVSDRIMETCCLSPAASSQKIAEMMLELQEGDEEFVARWRPLYRAAFTASGEAMAENGSLDRVPGDGDALSGLVEEDLSVGRDVQGPPGWRMHVGPWKPLPIGVVP